MFVQSTSHPRIILSKMLVAVSQKESDWWRLCFPRRVTWWYSVKKRDLFLSWSWLEVSDRQSALTPPYLAHLSLNTLPPLQRPHADISLRNECVVSSNMSHFASWQSQQGWEGDKEIDERITVLPVTSFSQACLLLAYWARWQDCKNRHKASF